MNGALVVGLIIGAFVLGRIIQFFKDSDRGMGPKNRGDK